MRTPAGGRRPERWWGVQRTGEVIPPLKGTEQSCKDGPVTDKSDSHESFIRQGIHSPPHHLPFLRIGRACLFRRRLRPLRLLQPGAGWLRARDLAGDSGAPRCPGRPPLRVWASRDAAVARWSLLLPGVRLGGPPRGISGPSMTDARWSATSRLVSRRRWNLYGASAQVAGSDERMLWTTFDDGLAGVEQAKSSCTRHSRAVWQAARWGTSSLAWELSRGAGRLRKVLRSQAE